MLSISNHHSELFSGFSEACHSRDLWSFGTGHLVELLLLGHGESGGHEGQYLRAKRWLHQNGFVSQGGKKYWVLVSNGKNYPLKSCFSDGLVQPPTL